MKNLGALRNFAIFTTVASLVTSLQGQTYTVNASVGGGMQINLMDYAASPQVGLNYVNFTSISDTISYDATAETIRQQGSISLATSIPSVVFNQTETIHGQSVTGLLTINQTPANGTSSSFNFDTGAQAVVPASPGSQTLVLNKNQDNPVHAGAGFANIFAIPINATYSLIVGGQTYTGNFGYVLYADYGLPLFSTFTPTGIGGNLTVGGFGSDGMILTYSGFPTFSISETNGFSMQISPAIDNLSGIVLASTPSTLTLSPAAPVPDQFATLPLFALGALGLFGFRRKLATS